jgi:NTP pyrophosphatase (non-canonical NTP hydrolase)
MNLKEIMKRILNFRDNRDWQQFHDPKNLAEAISIEAAELQEVFLWSDVKESRKIAQEKKQEISEELADIFIFSLLFAHDFWHHIFLSFSEGFSASDPGVTHMHTPISGKKCDVKICN